MSRFAGNYTSGGRAAIQLDNNSTRTLRHVTIAHPEQGSYAAIKITNSTPTIPDTIVASFTVAAARPAA